MKTSSPLLAFGDYSLYVELRASLPLPYSFAEFSCNTEDTSLRTRRWQSPRSPSLQGLLGGPLEPLALRTLWIKKKQRWKISSRGKVLVMARSKQAKGQRGIFHHLEEVFVYFFDQWGHDTCAMRQVCLCNGTCVLLMCCLYRCWAIIANDAKI